MAVAQVIPAVTAAPTQSVALVETMQHDQLTFNPDGLILYVLADLGHVIGHIHVRQVWDADHL